MSPNLCRCGTHMRILRAIDRAARTLQAGDAKTASTK
jgi:nicotinate dehydrogenase subunit A